MRAALSFSLPLYRPFDRLVNDLADDARREVSGDVRVAVVGETLPEFGVSVESHDRPGEVARRVGDHGLLSVSKPHPLGPDCRRDDGNAVRQRLADLSL